MNKKTGKIIAAAGAGAAALCALAAAAAYATTSVLVKTALDREQPKLMKKSGAMISGGTPDAALLEKCAEAAEALEAMPHETVTVTADDGVRLTGHFFPCENAKRIIIAFHGWRSSWKYDYGLISDFWHKNGCSVLYAEQRGQNNSGGEYMGFGLTERRDCVCWVRWALCRCGRELPIYLAGVSMGAATVLMASDLEFPVRLSGIMADCGFTSPKAIWKHVAEHNLHMVYGIRSKIADAICRRKINMNTDEYSTTQALANTDVPILFVHGTDDSFVPVEMTYENYKACAAPKQLLIVPGADHAMSYCVDRAAYERAVLDFWRNFDKREII